MAQYNWPPSSGYSTVTVANFPNPVDTNIGNASASTIRTVIASDQPAIAITSSTLATEATLAAMSAKLPAALGQLVSAASLSVVLSSDQVTLLSSEATLAAISAKLPATLGQATMAGSLAVTIASDQIGLIASETTLSTLNGKITQDFGASTTGVRVAAQVGSATGAADFGSGTVSAQTLRVVLPTDQPAIAITDGGGSITVDGSVSVSSSALPTGAATEVTLSAISGQLPAALGQTTMAASFPVVFASNQSALAVSNIPATVDTDFGAPGASTIRVASMLGVGGAAASTGTGAADSSTQRVVLANESIAQPTGYGVATTVRNDYSGTPVTTGAWVQLVASLGSAVKAMHIFDSSGQTLELGIGAAAAETRLILIPPGGNDLIPVGIASGTRVSIRAVSASATEGELDINFLS